MKNHMHRLKRIETAQPRRDVSLLRYLLLPSERLAVIQELRRRLGLKDTTLPPATGKRPDWESRKRLTDAEVMEIRFRTCPELKARVLARADAYREEAEGKNPPPRPWDWMKKHESGDETL